MQLKDFAAFLAQDGEPYKLRGDEEAPVDGFCSLDNLSPQKLTWVRNNSAQVAGRLSACRGLVVVCGEEGAKEYPNSHAYILTDFPRRVFFMLLNGFFAEKPVAGGISPTAIVETEAVGQNCTIGHNTYICKDAVLEDGVVIGHSVVIQSKCHIGQNSIIHSGARVGVDGYGYYEDRFGMRQKIPHFGGVHIGRNVEIGANTIIDRGTLDDTFIGDNVKIGCICHIGHNARLEPTAGMVAMSMLSGSVVLEKGAYVAPGVTIRDGVRVGENAVVGVGAAVVKDVPPGTTAVGVPAKAIK